MKNKDYSNKGITLVALIVTVVILIILSAIVIKIAININIIGCAIDSTQQYASEQDRENEILENLYSTILIADNDNAEITISTKTLKALIQEEVKNAISETTKSYDSKILELNNKISKLEDNSIGFIDYNNLIKTINTPGESWTATEDCAVLGNISITGGGGTAIMYVDGKEAQAIANVSAPAGKTTAIRSAYYVKKGSVISTREGDNYYYAIRIYGLSK